MHATRFLPALALLVLFPARADESTASKATAPADGKKADTTMSCCAGEEAALCPKLEPAKAASKKKPAPKAVEAKAPAGSASMIVSRDPVTGKLRPPTAEEVRALNALRPQTAAAEPRVVILPNGTKMVRMGPETANYVVARRNPDGTLTEVCVEGADAAAAAATAATATQPPAPSSAPRKEER